MNRLLQISLKPFYGIKFLKDRIFSVDDGHNIFFGFQKKLRRKNIEIHTYDMWGSTCPDIWMYCDIPYPWQIHVWKDLLSHRGKNILFSFESPLVNPFSQMRWLHKTFTRVYTWNDALVDNRTYVKFYIPQLRNEYVPSVKFKDKKLLTCINARKSALLVFKWMSAYREDLYKKRIEAINFFTRRIPREFDLYGRGWTAYNGKGEVADKIATLDAYKFCICFENCAADGYITEKIFDCFRAGTVPIYLGPKNVETYFDKGTFINARQFPNYDALLSYITHMKEDEYRTYIMRTRAMLGRASFVNRWFADGFQRIFIDAARLVR